MGTEAHKTETRTRKQGITLANIAWKMVTAETVHVRPCIYWPCQTCRNLKRKGGQWPGMASIKSTAEISLFHTEDKTFFFVCICRNSMFHCLSQNKIYLSTWHHSIFPFHTYLHLWKTFGLTNDIKYFIFPLNNPQHDIALKKLECWMLFTFQTNSDTFQLKIGEKPPKFILTVFE